MATITNFDEWLDEACDGSPADVYGVCSRNGRICTLSH